MWSSDVLEVLEICGGWCWAIAGVDEWCVQCVGPYVDRPLSEWRDGDWSGKRKGPRVVARDHCWTVIVAFHLY